MTCYIWMLSCFLIKTKDGIGDISRWTRTHPALDTHSWIFTCPSGTNLVYLDLCTRELSLVMAAEWL